jgi:hypothetical protein
MLYLLYIFLAIALFKFVNNFAKYHRCKWYLKQYGEYIKQPSWKFDQHQPQIVKLFQDAGIEDVLVSRVAVVGMTIQTSQASAFQNLAVREQDVPSVVSTLFHRTIGVYRNRLFETVNPLYWIETIIYLPREMLKYLGVSSENVGAKLLQVVYWIGGGITGVAFVWYRPDLKNFVDELVKRAFP